MTHERDQEELNSDWDSGGDMGTGTTGARDLGGDTGEYVGGEGGTAVGDDLGGGIGTGETDLGGDSDLGGDAGYGGQSGQTGQMGGETWGDRTTEAEEGFGGGGSTYQEVRGQGA